MYVLKKDKSKQIKFTGRWYIDPSLYQLSERLYQYSTTYYVYPENTLYLEVEFEQTERVKIKDGYTVRKLFGGHKEIPAVYETVTSKKLEFISEYDFFEINTCGE